MANKRKKKKKSKTPPKKSFASHQQQGQDYVQRKEYKKAIKAWREALKIKNDPELAKRLAQLHFHYALSLDRDSDARRVISELHQCIHRNGSKAIYHFHLGLIHHKLEEYPQAIGAYQKAVKLAPENERFLKHLKVAEWQAGKLLDVEQGPMPVPLLSLIEEGEFQEAFQVLEKKKDKLHRPVELYQAMIATMQQDYTSAKKLWKEVQQDSELSSLASYYLGVIYTQEQKWPSALKYLEDAAKDKFIAKRSKPLLVDFYKHQAMESEQAKDEKKAKRFWNKVAELAPEDELAYNAIAASLQEGYQKALEDNLSQAMRTWKRLINKGFDHPLLLQSYAVACERQEHHEQACTTWKQLAEVWEKQLAGESPPDNLSSKLALVHWRIGDLLASIIGHLDRAYDAYSAALKYDPNNVELQIRQVKLLLTEGDFDKGITKLEKLHQQQPENQEILEILVAVSLEIEEIEGALIYASKLLTLNPKDSRTRKLLRLAGVSEIEHLLGEEEFKEAERLLKLLLKADSEYIPFHVLLARAFFEQEEQEKAEQQLENTLAASENPAKVHAEIAKLYLQLESPKKADSHLKEAEKVGEKADQETLRVLTVVYWLRNRKKKANRFLKEYLATDPKNPELFKDLADDFVHQHREDLALEMLKKGAKEFPKSLEIGILLTVLALREGEDRLFEKQKQRVRRLATEQKRYDILEALSLMEMMAMIGALADEDEEGDFFDEDDFFM